MKSCEIRLLMLINKTIWVKKNKGLSGKVVKFYYFPPIIIFLYIYIYFLFDYLIFNKFFPPVSLRTGGGDRQHGDQRGGGGVGVAGHAGVAGVRRCGPRGEAGGGLPPLHFGPPVRHRRLLPPLHAGPALLPR